MLLNRFCAGLLGLLAVTSAQAQEAAPKLPRYASLSSDKVYLRQGPTYAYRILWVYHRKGLPVLITAEYDVWRKVRLPDGAEGWVHRAMLSGRRTVMVTGKTPVPLRSNDNENSRIVALAAPGVIGMLGSCTNKACEIHADNEDGWIAKDRLWGVAFGKDRS